MSYLPNPALKKSDILSDSTAFPGADIPLIKGYIDTEVAAIKAKTDNLPASPAAQTKLDTLAADYTTTRAGYLDNIANYAAGRTQVLEVSVTSAANAGDVTLATVTTQPCIIDSIIIYAVTAQTANMTTCAVTGGASKVITFIGTGDATQANLNAIDKQISWTGSVRLSAAKTIVISLLGTGAAAVDLKVSIVYKASVTGGYLV